MRNSKISKLLKCVIPVASACIITSATMISCNNVSFKEDAKNMLTIYKEMVAEYTNDKEIPYYDNKSAEEINNDKTRELIPITISGVDTYYFGDIRYDDLIIHDDSWPAKEHVVRARAMAISSYKHNLPEVMDIVIKLLNYWVLTEHRCSNWWWNEIGGNRDMTGGAIYCFDQMPEKAQKALLGRLERSSFYYRPETKTHTGANLVDFAEITLKSSLLRKNRNEYISAVKRMEEEITDENVEGFQKDGEFFQHGRQVQTCSSYGRSAFRMGNFMHVTNASKTRKVSKKKLNILSRFIIDGLAPATHKGYMNYLTTSREYVREGHLVTKNNEFPAIKNFAETKGMPRLEEIQEYSKNLDEGKSTFSGLRYFDIGRMIMINTDDLYISFKGTADYLVNTECNSDENRLGLNLSYGTNTCVMDNGNEYSDVSPVWDFAYLPGTTSYQLSETISGEEGGYDKYLYESDQMVDNIRNNYYKDGTYGKRLDAATDKNDYYYGGGYDEKNGVAYLMQRSCHHEENNFTVTCIATKDGMVLLGADLGYTGEITEGSDKVFESGSRKLHTTLEQSLTKDRTAIKSDDSKTLTFGNALYRVLDDHNIELKQTKNNGHWKRNHKHDGTEKPISGNVTLAYISHGDNRTNAKYAYSIQNKSHQNEKFELVHNFDGNKVQEVKLPDGTVAIAAYENVKGYQTSKGNKIDLVKGDFKLI